MDQLMGLTQKYLCLYKFQQAARPEDGVDYGMEMDSLYRQIAERPITTIVDVLEKMYFMQHCLGEEVDIQETLRLLKQVIASIERGVAPDGDVGVHLSCAILAGSLINAHKSMPRLAKKNVRKRAYTPRRAKRSPTDQLNAP